VRLELDFSKTVDQNAQVFFERAKKAKKKLAGLKAAKQSVSKQLELAREKKISNTEKKVVEQKRKKEWFEKFHWCFTQSGLLVIGGRDAKSNEQIVKKHMEKDDLFFHADIFGAPHCVLKTDGKKPFEEDKSEAAQFAGVFSKAWESGAGKVDVYSASPDQVTKSAPTGEAIGKGAFMVYGKREWFRNVPLEFSVGLSSFENVFRVESGSLKPISERCRVFCRIVPGENEKSRLAKQLVGFFEKKTGARLSGLLLDEVMAMLPTGKTSIVKEK